MSISVRSRRVGSMARFIFSVLAVTFFSALVLVGCSKEEDNDDNIVNGVNVVNGPNEAWTGVVGEHPAGMRFKSNHEVEPIGYSSGGWYVIYGVTATWAKNGNNIIITQYSGAESYNYLVSVIDNNSLMSTENGEIVIFTRNSINWRNNNNDDNIVNGVNVVNGPNEAWTSTQEGYRNMGMRLKPNHEVELINYSPDGWWVYSFNMATWSKNGNNIIFTIHSGSESGTYIIYVTSNNSLTATGNGENVTFTRNSINWR